MEGTLHKIQEDEDRFSDIFYKQPDSNMTNPVFDNLRDDRRRFGEIHNSGSLLFQGDLGVSPSISASVSNQDFSINQNSSGDLRLSMPAPKRTLPTSIVDSLNEDSLFFTGGQQHVFGSGLGSPYLHLELSASGSHSNNNLYMLGGDQLDNDSEFDKRGPRSFSLGEDTFPVSTALPSAEFLYNRPASTPLTATFSSSSSSQILQYQQNSPNNQNSQFHRQVDVGNHNTLQQQYEPDMPYSRTIAQQQQQQVYPQHVPPSNLQIHLADIDRRMEIRRGKSAGPCSNPYDGNPMSHGTGDTNSSASIRQQQALASNRSGNAMPNFRPHVQIESMMMQQRPASTPLPMSLPSNNMHHTHQPLSDHTKTHGPPLLNLCGLEDSSVEDIVAKSCRDILIDAASHSLKAVELANTLRARVGTEVLAHIRERWGGLLSLLERHTHVFRVERIPKNDLVTLVGGVTPSGGQVAQAAPFRGGRPLPTPTFIGQPQGQGQGQGQGGGDQGQGLGQGQVQGPFYNGVNDYMVPGGLAGSGEGTVSRCLHVGNVPANMTETQLLRELERYGDVDCLKLVSQRCRRFAFVSFRTVEQAISAKQRMTRVHPWKSAISFAHKESQSMSTPLSLLGSSGSPAPYGFTDQQQQYFASPPSPSHSTPPGQGQSQSHGHAQLTQNYQQQQQQQHQSNHNSNSASHSNMTLSVLQKQQDEEEELNQMFTRSLSVPPLAPTASAYQRYNMDSVFGSGSTTALDSMGSGSFAPGAGLGITRPASTGSVNLDGNGCLYNPSLSVPPYSYSGSTANLSSMGIGTIRRDAAPTQYGGFDYQGESSNSSSHSLSVAGGVASIGRGLMGSPQSGSCLTRQASRSTADDGNLGLDLDYDYDYDHMLTNPPPMTAVDRDRGLGQGQGQGLQMTAEQGQNLGQNQGALMQASSSSTTNPGVDFVLRRLCDDTYVPTQPWPVRWEVDAFYCSAVIAQLQQFGGVTTISKLRGFLRSRVNATDNIKSVPLKAMLSGYPGFFTVRSNQVTLAPDPNFSPVGAGPESNMNVGGQPPQGLGQGQGQGQGAGLGGMRGHVHSLSQGTSEFDMRSASGLSPSTSPPSPSFGYGLM